MVRNCLLIVSVGGRRSGRHGRVDAGDHPGRRHAVGQVDTFRSNFQGDRVGKSIPIRIARGGEPREIDVTVGERQRQAE